MSDLACNPVLTLTGLVYNTSYCMACSTVLYVTVPWTVFPTSIQFLTYFTPYFNSSFCPSCSLLHTMYILEILYSCVSRFFCLFASYSCCTDWSRGTHWHGWFRHCAARRKISGLIPDGVVGIFHWRNRSGRTMALGLTHPLTEVSTRNISWGGVKVAGA